MPPHSAPASTAAILVVDDDPDARATMRDILEEQGYAVCEAANGQEALDFLIFHQDVRIQLILLDLRMPIMTGWDFLALKSNYARLAEIPVLVVSAFTALFHSSQFRGVAGQLAIPYDAVKLRQAVQAVTGLPA